MKRMLLATVACCVAGWCFAQDAMDVESAMDSEMQGRAALAEELFAPVSFNIGSYFYIQEDLKQYMSGLTVNDPQWAELKKLHAKKDYLGMIGVLKGEKQRGYPPKEEIRRLHERFLQGGYGGRRISYSLTHKITTICRAFPGSNVNIMLGQDFRNSLCAFTLSSGKCMYIYSPDEKIDLMIKKYGDARDKVREDIKLARIYKEEGEAKIAELNEKQFKATLKWLATAKVKPGELVNSRKPMSVAFWREFNSAGKEKSSDKKVEAAGGGKICPDCNGKKYVVSEKQCEKCEGAGFTYSESSIKDLNGNKLPPKKSSCMACKGKGVINLGRKKCSACDGTGRLPEE